MAQPTVAPQNAGPTPAPIDPNALAPQATPGAATQKLQFMMQNGQPTPADVAKLMTDNPGERDQMMTLLQQSYGNGYVQQVIAAVQATPQPSAAAPKDIGPKSGGAIAASAVPLNPPPVKSTADKYSASPLNQQQANYESSIVPPESILPGGQAAIDRQQTPMYLGTNTPVPQAPGAVPVPATTNTVANGVQTSTFNDDKNPSSYGWVKPPPKAKDGEPQAADGGPGSVATPSTMIAGNNITTNTTVNKSVVAPTLPGQTPIPATDDQKANDLRALRASVAAALDDQAKSEGAFTGSPSADAKAAQQARLDQIKAAKAAAAKASPEELMKIIGDNNLLVKPPESLISSSTTTTTSGTNAGGLLDGSAVATVAQKDTNVKVDGTATTTTTKEGHASIGTKGVDIGGSASSATVNPATGTSTSNAVKAGVTGGITDPLRAGVDYKGTDGSLKVDASAGVTMGNGFGGVAGGFKVGKGDDPKKDPAAVVPTPATPTTATPTPTATPAVATPATPAVTPAAATPAAVTPATATPAAHDPNAPAPTPHDPNAPAPTPHDPNAPAPVSTKPAATTATPATPAAHDPNAPAATPHDPNAPAAKPGEADPNAPAATPAAAKPGMLAGLKPSIAGTGQLGIVQNENGTGIGGGGTGTLDGGGKSISAGAYGSADGALQILVTPTPDGGCVVTLTASVKVKIGGFLGKRGPDEAPETGNDWSAGGGAGVEGSKTVTRSRKLSKDDATRLLGQLDGLSSGLDGSGKKTFGTRAAEQAYKTVFGTDIRELMTGDPKPGPGETLDVQKEEGFGAEGKGGASGGDSKGSRGSVGLNGSFDHVEIGGHTESEANGITTYTIKFGQRTKGDVGGSAGFGAASMTAGVNASTQEVNSYVFAVPTAKADLLAQVRALADEPAAKKFQADHPDLSPGTVKNNVDSNGNTVGANVGPAGIAGGTTSTVEQNIASGHHTVIGPDGKPMEQKDLSGTIDGKRDDTASASLLGVKLAQSKETNEAKGTVDPNGQASLDTTTTTSGSNAYENFPKGAAALKATDKTDLAVMGATGGPMAYIKKLAEAVGESSTVGAHFDPASFDTLVAIAGDTNRWMKAILVDYRSEWGHLGAVLRSPNPPADWIKQDESPGHVAAMQLTRIKAFATFMSIAGDKGTAAINAVRGATTGNEIGQTVSWPPSLQGERSNFDDLAKKVEHLKPELSPFAQAGDKDGGTAFLNGLMTSLDALHTKVINAPDHADQVAAVHAGEGLLNMEKTVSMYQTRFTAALAAHDAKKPASEIDGALDGAPPKSAAYAPKVEDQAAIAAKAHEEGNAVPVPYKGTDKQWAAHDKAVNNALSTEANALDQKAQLEAQQRQAQDDEAAEAAKKDMPNGESVCADAKGKAFAALDAAFYGLPTGMVFGGGHVSDVGPRLMTLGSLMNDWAIHWQKLHDLYKTGKMPDGYRTDLAPKVSGNKLAGIMGNEYILQADKDYAEHLKSQWGGPF